MFVYTSLSSAVDRNAWFRGAGKLHPVSVRRFPSFRTQPLENLSVDSLNNGFLSNPAPGDNLLSGNLVMETGCTAAFRVLSNAPTVNFHTKNCRTKNL